MSDFDPANPSESEALPRPFGTQYVLLDRIGVGGMAEIYLARGRTQSGVGRLAVVKLVLPRLSRDDRFSALLVQEAKLAAQLSHGNVVQTFDLGRESGRLFIAMEYVEGFDLNELLKRCSKQRVPLPFEFALLIVRETLEGLDYAHRKRDADGRPLNIVHRDVSPSNILISFEGEVKLCDFGIALAMNSREVGTETIEGKASYMSPEHARGDSIDSRADIFSLSVILWELIAGRRMYRASAGTELIALARAGDVPPLPDKPLPDFERLRAIVHKGLARSPGDRFPTAMAMAHALDEYAMDNGLRATPMALGEFVVEHFGQEILERRRERERAAIALESIAPPPAEREITATKQIVAPPPDEWDESTVVDRRGDEHTSPAPSTVVEDGEHTVPSAQPTPVRWPSTFPPTHLPSMIPPPSALTAEQPFAGPPQDPQSNLRRLLALVLGALVTLALGALILGRR